jgi:acyl carrier protein
MDKLENRLMNCFIAVFPDVSLDEIRQSAQSTTSRWDSIAVITMANLIEEEFGFRVNFDRLPEFDSYEHVLAYVREELQGQACETVE